MSIRIKNQGKRIFQFGLKQNEVLKPGGVVILNDEVGAKLLKSHPKELIDLDNLTVDFDQTKMEDFSDEETKPARGKPGPKPKAKELDE